MTPITSLEKIAKELLETKELILQSCKTIQTLWAGYGHIARVTASSKPTDHAPDAEIQTYILKYVSPPLLSSAQPRLKNASSKAMTTTIDEGHVRKVLSYQIEQRFYVHLGPLIPKDIAIASCVAHSLTIIQASGGRSDSVSATLLMTDLRTQFPVAGEDNTELSQNQAYGALAWLANFHGFWWTPVQKRENLALTQEEGVLSPLEHITKHATLSLDCYGTGGLIWQKGGYSHLATRRKEFEALRAEKRSSRSEWSQKLCRTVQNTEGLSIAELVDVVLNPPPENYQSRMYQTVIHGDVKSENLFSTVDGAQVAFYDFQYVGLGLGVSDLAKLFTVCVPLEMLVEDEADIYRAGELGLGMTKGEEQLLRKYLQDLEARAEQPHEPYEWSLFERHWEAALVDWLRFQSSWGFWGNTEWLEARVRKILQDKDWLRWLVIAVRDW